MMHIHCSNASIDSAFTRADQPAPFDYNSIEPPEEICSFHKQAAKRHFGVHGYFTKQVWSVVRAYIARFTKPGDVVLDAFGGSGVTAIEALLLGRRAIHVDLNPLSKFLVDTLLTPVDIREWEESFNDVLLAFEDLRPRSKADIHRLLEQCPYPRNVPLPRNADVDLLEDLFTPKQLSELALLKKLILENSHGAPRQHLLLMFSGLLNKINRTYHASSGRSEGRGDSGIFRYYRYRIAHDSPELEITKVFRSRFSKVLAAKRELLPILSLPDLGGVAHKGSATNLFWIQDESIDYIYTDPPYGSKIPYLDLSTMWNEWLDLPVTHKDRALEAIEGGESCKTKAEYSDLISTSIKEMYRVMRFDRWLSFVFSHEDPNYWQLIVETAEQSGFEYVNVTRQGNGQASFKKRQNPFSVLTGQLILNFKKTRGPHALRHLSTDQDTNAIVTDAIGFVISKYNGATFEQINNALVISGLEAGVLQTLAKQYSDLSPLLRKHFRFGPDGRWHFPQEGVNNQGPARLLAKSS